MQEKHLKHKMESIDWVQFQEDYKDDERVITLMKSYDYAIDLVGKLAEKLTETNDKLSKVLEGIQ